MSRKNDVGIWQRFSGVYDVFMQKDCKAYDLLGQKIIEQMKPDMRVLELACGTGLVSARVADGCKEYIATDFSQKMLNIAQRKEWSPHVRFEQADATALQYEAESFDVVIISNALHIMPNPVAALENIRKVLRKDGVLIAPTFLRPKTAKAQFVANLIELAGLRTYSKWSFEGYCEFLRQNGWGITHSEVVPSTLTIAYVICKDMKLRQ